MPVPRAERSPELRQQPQPVSDDYIEDLLTPDPPLPGVESAGGDVFGRFFSGLAAGEAMDRLIGELRRGLLQAGEPAIWPLFSLSPPDLAEEQTVSKMSCCFTTSSSYSEIFFSPSYRHGRDQERDEALTPTTLSTSSSSAPFPNTATGCSSSIAPFWRCTSSRRAGVQSACRAAALFSVESPTATEALTVLFFASAALERRRLAGALKGRGAAHLSSSSSSASSSLASSHFFFFRPAAVMGGLRGLLSDRTAIALARRLAQAKNERLSHEGLQVLAQVPVSPGVCAVQIELCSRTGDAAGALRALQQIPLTHWTELDVAGVLRAVYRAARREHQEAAETITQTPAERTSRHGKTEKPNTDGEKSKQGVKRCTKGTKTGMKGPPTSHFEDRERCNKQEEGAQLQTPDQPPRPLQTSEQFWRTFAVEFGGCPLGLLRTAARASLRWSTPAAMNDALGLLALWPARWQEACHVLNETLLARDPNPTTTNPPLRDDTACQITQTEASNKEPNITPATGTTTSAAQGATIQAEQGQAEKRPQEEASEDDWEAIKRSSTQGDSHLRGFAGARPNAVTVYQTCRALRQAPAAVAFDYAAAVVEGLDGPLTTDFKATEAYLGCCAHAGQWREALRVLKTHRAHFIQTEHQRLGRRDGREASTTTTIRSSSASPHAPRYSHEVHFALAKLFARVHCTEDGELLRKEKALSKFYNSHTLSRALNSLLQGAESTKQARRYCEALARVLIRGKTAAIPTPTTIPATETTTTSPTGGICLPEALLSGLENESLHQIALLNALEGHWREALAAFEPLLRDPQRRLYVPTTEIHDSLQYALAAAPEPGGAPWKLSVELFWELCRERELPTSPVAFQSTLRKCFSQGAGDVAQTLICFLIQKGVRR